MSRDNLLSDADVVAMDAEMEGTTRPRTIEGSKPTSRTKATTGLATTGLELPKPDPVKYNQFLAVLAMAAAIVTSCIVALLGAIGLIALRENVLIDTNSNVVNTSQMAQSATPAAVITSDSADKQLRVEIADSEEERARGLMYRNALALDAGMLFVYPEPAVVSFWMKNTYIPLDIVYISEDKTIVNVAKNATPLNDSVYYTSKQKVQYVLEVNAGVADQNNYSEGVQLYFDI